MIEWIDVQKEPIPSDRSLVDYIYTASTGPLRLPINPTSYTKDTIDYYIKQATFWSKKINKPFDPPIEPKTPEKEFVMSYLQMLIMDIASQEDEVCRRWQSDRQPILKTDQDNAEFRISCKLRDKSTHDFGCTCCQGFSKTELRINHIILTALARVTKPQEVEVIKKEEPVLIEPKKRGRKKNAAKSEADSLILSSDSSL